jgi:hypothetical protein
LQIIDSGCKSGKLTIVNFDSSKTENNSQNKGLYHLWFDKGRLVAMTNIYLVPFVESQNLKQLELQAKIGEVCSIKEPIGLCLCREGFLSQEKLQSIFQEQLEQVYRLFEATSGSFKFQDIADNKDMPWQEMTGESMGGLEVALNGLRKLKNWEQLASALPEPNCTLEQLVIEHKFKLEPLEFKLWKFADSTTPLSKFAEVFKQPIAKVQKAAYCLIIAELVEGFPAFDFAEQKFLLTNTNQISPEPELLSVASQQANNKPKVSNSLLGNLLSFLENI